MSHMNLDWRRQRSHHAAGMNGRLFEGSAKVLNLNEISSLPVTSPTLLCQFHPIFCRSRKMYPNIFYHHNVMLHKLT